MQLKNVNYEILFLDLDLDPKTLILKPDLDIIKMSMCTKNEVPTFSSSSYHLNRQTDKLH